MIHFRKKNYYSYILRKKKSTYDLKIAKDNHKTIA